ncbi:MAG: hypothetical protein ACM33T_14415 [Solirubrobacterales bacterium]
MDIQFDTQAALRHYLDGDHAKATEVITEYLERLSTVCIQRADDTVQTKINEFCQSLGFLFTRADFVVPRGMASRVIGFNETIANLFSISRFRSTDSLIEQLLVQPNNFIKLLALYSPRNSVAVDRSLLFGTDAGLATMWYYAYVGSTHGYLADTHALANLRQHLAYQDPRMTGVPPAINHTYFGVTYIDPSLNAVVKHKINQLVRTGFGTVDIQNKPKSKGKKKIGVFTDRWYKGHVVHRVYYDYMKELAKDYDLVLIAYTSGYTIKEHIDRELFSDVKFVVVRDGRLDLDAVKENDFHAVIFVDVGMSVESIFTSNLRLAPIQIIWGGHPVSTFGGEVDYFMGGTMTFNAHDYTTEFSERLVVTPGIGARTILSTYKPTYEPKPPGIVYINCPWTAQKTNAEHLQLLRRIRDRVSTPIKYRFFPLNTILKNNALLPFRTSLGNLLGADVVEVMNVQNDAYMQSISLGDMALEANPFGGFNSVLDSLYYSQPIVVLPGKYLYSRLGTQILSHVGLEELIARDPDDYVDKAVRLIDDADHRAAMSYRISTHDLDSRLSDPHDVEYFKVAIDHIMQNHDQIQKQRPHAPLFLGPIEKAQWCEPSLDPTSRVVPFPTALSAL